MTAVQYANILPRSWKVRRSEGAQKGSMPTIVLETYWYYRFAVVANMISRFSI